MKISTEYKFVFIHIPKTGGTTLADTLPGADHNAMNFPHWHVNAKYISNNIENYSDYFSFAFVRNPWDRLYSIYRYNRAYEAYYRKLPQYLTHGINYFFECDFKTWLLEKKTWWHFDKSKDCLPTQIDLQSNYLIDINNNNITSYIGKYEKISNEYTQICDKLGVDVKILGNLSKSSRLKDFRKAYDNEMIDFVYQHHAEDIKQFNYVFE